jgi:hypothetical protein
MQAVQGLGLITYSRFFQYVCIIKEGFLRRWMFRCKSANQKGHGKQDAGTDIEKIIDKPIFQHLLVGKVEGEDEEK